MKSGDTRVRHDLDSFGTVAGHLGKIRIDRLSERLTPSVPFPHRHAFHQLLVITRGGGWHEIDFVRSTAKLSSAFFMRPGQVHAWSFRERTEGFIVEFSPEALDTRETKSDFSRILSDLPENLDLTQAPRARQERILSLLLALRLDYEQQPDGFELSLKHYLLVLLIELSRVPGERRCLDTAPADPFLERFLHLVEEHFSREHQVTFYASRMRISPKALTMRVSRLLNKSARSVIQERALLEARRLLAYSNYSIAEVGFELGYSDPNYFTRFFTKAMGETPSAFRQRVHTSANPRSSRRS